ncbi:MAG: glycosyltransferase [Gammaproteobacteria bacterium]
MNILFVHQNFPGQFQRLAPAAQAAGHQVMGLGIAEHGAALGVPYMRYSVSRANGRDIHPWVLDFETKVARGEACARAAVALRDHHGFRPDLIVVHPGWGESMFLRDVWPGARQLHYVEYFYALTGQDVGFDSEFDPKGADEAWRIRAKNANNLIALTEMDWGLSPTAWQRSLVPTQFQERISVIHDGIDTVALKPDTDARLEYRDQQGRTVALSRRDEVMTFCARNLEPMRGYHQFMRVLPMLMQRRPRARVVIIGGDASSYGWAPKGISWKQHMLNEIGNALDLSRVHFLGRVPYPVFRSALQVSSLHVYLSYPFVLSWSLLEAMALVAPILAADTAPVREVIEDGKTGLLRDFFDRDGLVEAAVDLLAKPMWAAEISARARTRVVSGYDLKTVTQPGLLRLIERCGAALRAPHARLGDPGITPLDTGSPASPHPPAS